MMSDEMKTLFGELKGVVFEDDPGWAVMSNVKRMQVIELLNAMDKIKEPKEKKFEAVVTSVGFAVLRRNPANGTLEHYAEGEELSHVRAIADALNEIDKKKEL